MTAPDWRAIADNLARALRSRPCNCEMDRMADGRIKSYEHVKKQCSRCAVLDRYDRAVCVFEAEQLTAAHSFASEAYAPQPDPDCRPAPQARVSR